MDVNNEGMDALTDSEVDRGQRTNSGSPTKRVDYVTQQIDNVVIQNLKYPWMDIEDRKPTDLEYELFCGALESFHSKSLSELVDDWTISLETLLPTIQSSIRMYSKAESDKGKVNEMDDELIRWAEFGLSSSQSTSYAENSRMVMIGCSLVKQLAAMHEKSLSTTFSEPRFLEYILNIILSTQFSSSIRCEAAQALLHILFHPSVSWKFMVVNIKHNEYTPYEQIVQLFMKPEDVPLDLLVILHKIADYFAFKYSTDVIVKCAQLCIVEEFREIDIPLLLSSFSIVQKFLSKRKNDFSHTSRIAQRILVKSRVIPHICVLATSPNQDTRVRHIAIQCLRTLCDFDGTDIRGAILLSHMGARTVSLVARLLQRAEECDRKVSLLAYALRAVVCSLVVDAPERVSVLHNMLIMLSVDQGRLALISALSFGDNLKHLLHICDIHKSALTSESHTDDDNKIRFRQTASYGYICEILFALARSQWHGTFWRKYGHEIGKLIDCNVISAATSLKQWLEPFREELALGTSMSTLNFLLIRLVNQSGKYLNGDPPLSLVSLLRLIDAVLDTPEETPFSEISSNEIRFDYCAMFYENDALDGLMNVLNVANNEQSKRVRDRCTSVAGDSYIYSQFVRSATSIIHKLLIPLQAVGQRPEKVIVDTLLRTYTLCCMDEVCSDRAIKDRILKSFSLFIPPSTITHQKFRKKSPQSFMKIFLNIGLEKPQNFFATLDIFRQLIPFSSNSLANVIKIDHEEVAFMENLWSSHVLECNKQLEFAVLLGISSSQRLKECLLDLFKRLAHLSKTIASNLADLLVKQSLKLLSSSQKAIVDAFGDDVVKEEESNIRFANAADLVISSFYAFMAVCSTDIVLRNFMVTVISRRKNYIVTLLKFFKVASPKTTPHLSFQRHVMKFFHNLCVVNKETDCEISHLPREMYIAICDALVEHFGNREHSAETALVALKIICEIGRFSTFGSVVVNKSVISREGCLLHFLDRFDILSGSSEKSLLEAAAQLLDLFENTLTKVSTQFVVLKSQFSSDIEKHPLLRLITQLTELGCSQSVLTSLQKLLEVTNGVEPLEEEQDDIETCDWPENAIVVQQVDSLQMSRYHIPIFSNLACKHHEEYSYSAPLSTVDLTMLNEEFFSGNALPTSEESETSALPQNHNPDISKAQLWKTSNIEGGVKRKYPYSIPKMRTTLIRSKIRRF